MHIFIDESGNFAVGAENHSPSLVGALIIPDHKIDKLFAKYAKMRRGLRKHGGEVKGKLLNEAEVARVVELIRKNSCIFEAVALDMGVESADRLTEHRAGQAEEMARNLTSEHHPELIKGVKELQARLEKMPLPLYAQSVATIYLLGNVIRVIPAYWTLRVPKETLNFHWVVDGKEVGKVTSAEDWWSTTMLPLMQSRSYREPMATPAWVKNSAFDEKFRIELPGYLKDHMPDAKSSVDLTKIMKESFRFSSDPEPGLELVDIVTNATRRALIGNLGKAGWGGVPRLMIHTREQYLKLITLGRTKEEARRPYADMLMAEFKTGGRSMLPPNA